MKLNGYYLNLIFYCIIVSLLITLYAWYFKELVRSKSFLQNPRRVNEQYKIKYILEWTSSDTVRFEFMGKGRQVFIGRNCQYTNCFVTENKSLLGDYRKFDVIAFSGPEIAAFPIKLPEYRSPHQKYVFASIESSDFYPVCSDQFKNYFNWTWTYKLDSDVRWGYIVIRNVNRIIIGPKKDMNWLTVEEMKPVSEKFKKSLKTKQRAAAWFVSNCEAWSERQIVAQKLQAELLKFNHAIDIYGDCGNYTCPRENEPYCNRKIKDIYYFYLSFENSFSEDYVTEKLLHPLQNNAVPIVYGGANYSRFMPEGIYLDAVKLSVSELAVKMNELIMNPDKYAEYFKWKNHYSYHKTDEDTETDEYCQICKLLNDKTLMKKKSVCEDFTSWWNVQDTICGPML